MRCVVPGSIGVVDRTELWPAGVGRRRRARAGCGPVGEESRCPREPDEPTTTTQASFKVVQAGSGRSTGRSSRGGGAGGRGRGRGQLRGCVGGGEPRREGKGGGWRDLHGRLERRPAEHAASARARQLSDDAGVLGEGGLELALGGVGAGEGGLAELGVEALCEAAKQTDEVKCWGSTHSSSAGADTCRLRVGVEGCCAGGVEESGSGSHLTAGSEGRPRRRRSGGEAASASEMKSSGGSMAGFSRNSIHSLGQSVRTVERAARRPWSASMSTCPMMGWRHAASTRPRHPA